MAIEFNFNRLQNLYIATLHSFDKAMAFDIEIGRGRFLFMMYLSNTGTVCMNCGILEIPFIRSRSNLIKNFFVHNKILHVK